MKRRPNKPTGLTSTFSTCVYSCEHKNERPRFLSAVTHFYCHSHFNRFDDLSPAQWNHQHVTELQKEPKMFFSWHHHCECESSTVWSVLNVKKSWGWRWNHTQTQETMCYFIFLLVNESLIQVLEGRAGLLSLINTHYSEDWNSVTASHQDRKWPQHDEQRWDVLSLSALSLHAVTAHTHTHAHTRTLSHTHTHSTRAFTKMSFQIIW